MDLFVKAFLSYVEKHPEVVEKLVEQLVQYIIKEVTAHNANS